MAMVYRALELRLSPGRWRIVGQSDEDRSIYDDLCDCVNGHESPKAARACPEASARMDQIFPKDKPRVTRNNLMKMLRAQAPNADDEMILSSPVSISSLIGFLEACGVIGIEARENIQ